MNPGPPQQVIYVDAKHEAMPFQPYGLAQQQGQLSMVTDKVVNSLNPYYAQAQRSIMRMGQMYKGNAPVMPTEQDPVAVTGMHTKAAIPFSSPQVVHFVSIPSLQPKQATPSGSRDTPWVVLFLIQVIGLVLIAVFWGRPILMDQMEGTSTSKDSEKKLNAFSPEEARNVLLFAVGACFVAAIVSFCLLSLVVSFAKQMITFSLWFSVGLGALFALLAILAGEFFLSFFGVILVWTSIIYAKAVRNRIPFAAANLTTAAKALTENRSIYLIAILVVLLQVMWVLLWAIAFIGAMSKLSLNTQDSFPTLHPMASSVYFFLLVSLYWGITVWKNVGHVAYCGAVATWWYNTSTVSGGVASSLKRAFTTSFGSICLGSLLVSILKALKQMAKEGRQKGGAMACLAECILYCIELIMEYFNKWAFVYVGIYGYPFIKAGKEVFNIFRQRGFSAIVNDDLIGNVLGLLAFATGLITAGIAVGYYHLHQDILKVENAPIILGIIGLFVGMGIAVIPLSVVDSAVATIFVLFSESPDAFAQKDPKQYAALLAGWHQVYPDVMVQSGYYSTPTN